MKSIMNISFKSYVDIFNFISRVISLTILGEENMLYRYENIVTHHYEWPIKDPFTLKKRYVMKINNLANESQNKYDDVVVNIVTYRSDEEMCPPPVISASKPLFSDKDMYINILIETRFFLNKTFDDVPNTSVIIDRVSYIEYILNAIAEIFIEDDYQSEEVHTIIRNINAVLAYCIFTDKVVDQDIRARSREIIGYACIPDNDYIHINDPDHVLNILGKTYNTRPISCIIEPGKKSFNPELDSPF